jgi:uncharacterized protein
MDLQATEADVVAYLECSEHWAKDAENVETIVTHISRIFLAGDRVLKLKRRVKFPYLDFTTSALRKQACDAEVLINRRTAPDLYKGVVPVLRDDAGQYHLGEIGDAPDDAVDWLVEMARFDQDLLFDRMAKAGDLDRGLMERTAEVISDFHEQAEIATETDGYTEADRVIVSNRKCFYQFCPEYFSHDALNTLHELYDKRMVELGDLLDQRSKAGLLRHCHGDMHLGNICLIQNTPTLFDAIEFNPDFSHIDVLYDLAFTLMDLEHHGHRRLANMVMNRYFDVNGRAQLDAGNFQALALFLSIRAAVRSQVGAAQAASLEDQKQCELRAEEALSYLDMAIAYLHPVQPRLIAVGGLSGSGKSRMARELAAFVGNPPGARVVRTDVTRKRLAGRALNERLGADGYTMEMNTRTYDAFYGEIRKCLMEGQSVIADAVFAREDERRRVAGIAAEIGVPFNGLWLEAPREIMLKRVTERKNNVSDAGVDVVGQQLDYDLGDINWSRIDSSGSREQTLKTGLDIIEDLSGAELQL